MTKKIYLLLKATVTKMITVPQYTRADGTIVPAHQKTVHYDPDRDSKDIVAGKGTSAQREAHKKLSQLKHWESLSHEDKHAHILSSATNIQIKKTHNANVTRFKQSLLSGKVPSPGQYNSYKGLSFQQMIKLMNDVVPKIGKDKFDELMKQAETKAEGTVVGLKTAKPHHTEKKKQPVTYKKISQMTDDERLEDIKKAMPTFTKLGAKYVGEEFGDETSYQIPVGGEILRVFLHKDTCHMELVEILKKAKAEAEKHLADGTFKEWKRSEYFAKTDLSDDLIKYNYPDEVSGVKWDYPMTEEQADGGKVNPKFTGKKDGYSINCQTCVIAYEMRLRGYDVVAKEYGSSMKNAKVPEMKKLAHNVQRGWFDSTTKDGYPETHLFSSSSFIGCVQKMEEFIEHGKRYHFRVKWKGGLSGHIITVSRNEHGDIEFYDPQNGKKYSVDEYNQKHGKHIRVKGQWAPMAYRVDHCMLRKAYASSIFDKAGQ